MISMRQSELGAGAETEQTAGHCHSQIAAQSPRRRHARTGRPLSRQVGEDPTERQLTTAGAARSGLPRPRRPGGSLSVYTVVRTECTRRAKCNGCAQELPLGGVAVLPPRSRPPRSVQPEPSSPTAVHRSKLRLTQHHGAALPSLRALFGSCAQPCQAAASGGGCRRRGR